jgi:ribosomal protein L37AE/L43A
MIFNRGFLCPKCGPVAKAKDKTYNKAKIKACGKCDAPVTPWERPLNERPGRCRKCSHAGFINRIENGLFIRKCKKCNDEVKGL